MAPRRAAKKAAAAPTVQAEAVVADSANDAAPPASNGIDDKSKKIAKPAKAAKVNAKKAGAPKKNAKATEQNDDAGNENGQTTNGDAPDDANKPTAKGKGKQKKADEVVAPVVKKETKAAKGKSKKIVQETVDDGESQNAEPEPGPSKVVVEKKKGRAAKKNVEPVEEALPIESRGRRGGAKKVASPEKPVESEKPVKIKGKKFETLKTSAKASNTTEPKVEDEPIDETDDIEEEEEKVAPTKGRKRAAPAHTDAAAAAATTEKLPAKKGKKGTAVASAATTKEKVNGAPNKKRKAGVKAAADSTTIESDGELITKRKKGAKNDEPTESKMNPSASDFSQIDFQADKKHDLKIVSWNVAGLRALVGKNGLDYFEHEKPDIICLQEIKCVEEEVPDAAKLAGYHPYWCSTPGGHGGVAILSKSMPYSVESNLNDEEMDDEGRIITAEYSKFYVVCVYVPNAGRKLVNLDRRLRWNKLFEAHLTALKAKKPVIICGDMNVAHDEIDLANPKTNKKNAGFTQEERDGMTDLLGLGFIDTFRDLYPNKDKAYTFWTYMMGARKKNVGWRLDYAIVSENLKSKVVDSLMRPQVLGSDHCPIVLLMKN